MNLIRHQITRKNMGAVSFLIPRSRKLQSNAAKSTEPWLTSTSARQVSFWFLNKLFSVIIFTPVVLFFLPESVLYRTASWHYCGLNRPCMFTDVVSVGTSTAFWVLGGNIHAEFFWFCISVESTVGFFVAGCSFLTDCPFVPGLGLFAWVSSALTAAGALFRGFFGLFFGLLLPWVLQPVALSITVPFSKGMVSNPNSFPTTICLEGGRYILWRRKCSAGGPKTLHWERFLPVCQAWPSWIRILILRVSTFVFFPSFWHTTSVPRTPTKALMVRTWKRRWMFLILLRVRSIVKRAFPNNKEIRLPSSLLSFTLRKELA